MHEIYVRIPVKQLLILQLRIALFECLKSKFDTSAAILAVFRLFACVLPKILSISDARGGESFEQRKFLCARPRSHPSHRTETFGPLTPPFKCREALLMDISADCRHNGTSGSNSVLNLVRLLLSTAARWGCDADNWT